VTQLGDFSLSGCAFEFGQQFVIAYRIRRFGFRDLEFAQQALRVMGREQRSAFFQ
jgi:hypothetical protein